MMLVRLETKQNSSYKQSQKTFFTLKTYHKTRDHEAFKDITIYRFHFSSSIYYPQEFEERTTIK